MKKTGTNLESMNVEVSNYRESENIHARIKSLNQFNIGIDMSLSTLSKIDLFLIPIKVGDIFGFINKSANLVIKPQFDEYIDSFEDEDSLVRIRIGKKWGVINAKGEVIIPAKYSAIRISDNQQLFTVFKDYKTGVVDADHNIVIDFGEYSYIDGYDSGLARVKIKDKWGIIDTEGETILAVEYDNIWNFYKKNLKYTTIEKNGMKNKVYFSDLFEHNTSSVQHNIQTHYDSDDYDYHRPAYDYPEYNDSLDMDQQSDEFWNNF